MDRRIARLRDAEFRALCMAMLWSVSNRTDGVIEVEDVDLIPRFDATAAGVLVEADILEVTARGWLLSDFAATQTSRSELQTLENARRRDREKKARQRGRQSQPDVVPEAPDPGDTSADVPGDVSPGTAQERTGRTGQAGSRQRNSQGLGSISADACAVAPDPLGDALIGLADRCGVCGSHPVKQGHAPNCRAVIAS